MSSHCYRVKNIRQLFSLFSWYIIHHKYFFLWNVYDESSAQLVLFCWTVEGKKEVFKRFSDFFMCMAIGYVILVNARAQERWNQLQTRRSASSSEKKTTWKNQISHTNSLRLAESGKSVEMHLSLIDMEYEIKLFQCTWHSVNYSKQIFSLHHEKRYVGGDTRQQRRFVCDFFPLHSSSSAWKITNKFSFSIPKYSMHSRFCNSHFDGLCPLIPANGHLANEITTTLSARWILILKYFCHFASLARPRTHPISYIIHKVIGIALAAHPHLSLSL